MKTAPTFRLIAMMQLAIAAFLAPPALAESATDLDALNRELDRRLAEALAVEGQAAQPQCFQVMMQGAMIHHAVSARIDPSGKLREDVTLSCFRLGDGWRRGKLGTPSGPFGRRVNVSDLDLADLEWDGRQLQGKISAIVSRINPHRDYGEGENMHSMLKSHRRPVVNWSIGGRERLLPQPQTFQIQAELVKGKRILELRLDGFAGEARPARPPEPNDTTQLRHRECSALLGRERQPLQATLTYSDGEFVDGEGKTPSWNRAIHLMDGSGLTLTDDHLHGTLVVTLLPDPWVPPAGEDGERKRVIRCELDATLVDGRLQGHYAASGDQGEYEGELTGGIFRALEGTYVSEGVDGRLTGDVKARVQEAPTAPEDLAALRPEAFDTARGAAIKDKTREALEAYRRAHAKLLALDHLPLAAKERFDKAMQMPTPQFADVDAAASYRAALARYAAAQAGDGLPIRTGPVSPADEQFGPYVETAPLPDHVLPESVGQSGPQQWRLPQDWQAVGPLEWRGRTSWYPAALPAVVPAEDVSYVVQRPRLDETLAISRKWRPVEPGGGELEPHPQPWRETFPRQQKYGGYGAYPANELYYAHQNGNRSYRWYATTRLDSPRETDLWIAIRARDFGRLWVNGRLVWASGPEHEPSTISVLQVPLGKGENELLVETSKQHVGYHPPSPWDRSRFTLWVCTQGRPRDEAELARTREARTAARAETPFDVAGYFAPDGRQYPDATPPMSWDLETGKHIAWRHRLGGGQAPPVIADGKILCTVEPHHIVCIDAASGEKLWQRTCSVLEGSEHPEALEKLPGLLTRRQQLDHQRGRVRRTLRSDPNQLSKTRRSRLEAERDRLREQIGSLDEQIAPLRDRLQAIGMTAGRDGIGRRASAAPIVHGDRVYVVFGTGVAACFTLDGRPIWQRKTGLPFTGGAAFSPLLADGKLVLLGRDAAPRAQDRPLVAAALDAETGEPIWQSDSLGAGPAGLAAIRLLNGDREKYCYVTPDGTLVDGDDGRILYRHLFRLAGPVVPITSENIAYFTARNLGQAAIRFWLDDAGRIGCRKLWEVRRAGWSSPQDTQPGLMDEGLIYIPRSCDENAGHHPVAWDQLDVYEPEFGQHLARPNPVIRTASSPLPLVRAGELLVESDRGQRGHKDPPQAGIAFIQPGEQAHLLLEHTLGEVTLQCAPAFDGRRMFLRVNHELICVSGETAAARRDGQRELARSVFGQIGSKPVYKLRQIQPPPDFSPTENMPVGPLIPFLPPRHWLTTGPFDNPGEGPRGIEDIRSFAARPGTVVTPGEGEATFRPLTEDEQTMKSMTMVFRSSGTYYSPAYALDVGETVGKATDSTVYYFTILRCDEPTAAALHARGAKAWISGEPVEDEAAVEMGEGWHPMLLRVNVAAVPPFGTIVVMPRFRPILPERKAQQQWRDGVRLRRKVLERIADGQRQSAAARAKRYLSELEEDASASAKAP
ncbi:MAG: hypothetical protein ACOC93_00300 [Planctomycetota bacterium]